MRTETIPLEVGVAMVEITPPVGYPMYRGESTGITTPLYAKALVFKQGNVRGALLMCDLLTIPRDLGRLVREQASTKTGIKYHHISVAATHTHTGPDFREAIIDYAEKELNGKLTKEDHEGYMMNLIQGMTRAIVIANEQVQEVEMTTGIGSASDISFNRRFLMTNGRVRTNPGCLNPNILYPMGPIDPDVHSIMFRPINQDTLLTFLTVFANHTDTQGGTDFSADYPYYLQKHLREIFGKEATSIFGNGPCGNINHIDVSRSYEDTKKGMITEKIGKELAEIISKVHPFSEQQKPDLEVTSRTIYLPLQDFTKTEYEWALDDDASSIYNERPFLGRVRRGKIFSIEQIRWREAIPPVVSGDPWCLPLEIHVFKLNGQTAIVTLPGELFVELGIDLKSRSPFANTLIIELANADICYVPTRQAFAEGDYEPLNSRIAPGSGEKMIEEALQILYDISRR